MSKSSLTASIAVTLLVAASMLGVVSGSAAASAVVSTPGPDGSRVEALAVDAGDAAGEQRTFAISGSMLVGDPPAIPLPSGSTFTATIDPVTGVFSDGRLTIPTFDRGPVSGPQANITMTQVGLASGALDPATGESTMTVTLDVSIEVPLLSATCPMGSITSTSSSAGPGGSPFAGSPLRGVVTASGYAVPAVVGTALSATCDLADAAAINATLGLPSTSTSLRFEVVETTPAPEPVVPSHTG